MLAGAGLFGSLIYGFGNKYRYQLKRFKLSYANLPTAFKGLKIVHISDIHSGSFTDKQAVMRGVETILAEKPDLILFTGDLVNNTADEMEEYMDVFDKLKAPSSFAFTGTCSLFTTSSNSVPVGSSLAPRANTWHSSRPHAEKERNSPS